MKADANEKCKAVMDKGNNRNVLTNTITSLLNSDAIILTAFAALTQIDPEAVIRTLDAEAQKVGSTALQFTEQLEKDMN